MRLNGLLINEFTSNDPARDLTKGRIGLQNHGTGDEVYFRDVQVKTGAGTDPGTPTVQGFADPTTGSAPLARAVLRHRIGPGRRALSYKWVFGDGGSALGSARDPHLHGARHLPGDDHGHRPATARPRAPRSR